MNEMADPDYWCPWHRRLYSAVYSYPKLPTPDKILVFLIFVFMMFNEAWEMFKRFAPFVVILLVYDSFRGLVRRLFARSLYPDAELR